ncbi:MAG TPA: hypothetical protein VMS98_11660, partial [Thermoanaerobaculia bacterium]|nr:hypothetical protein [Thermoanaerobaculia bacterium]
VRRIGEDKFDLDIPPETFLNPTTAKLRSRTQSAAPQQSGGKKIGAVIGGLIAMAIVFALLRVGREGFSYMQVPWKPYAAADGTFKANFAGDPKEKTETLNINGDLWNFVSLQSRHKNHIYTVEYVDAYMVITQQNAQSVLDRFLEGWMSAVGATPVSKENISLSRNPAISFVATLPKGAGGGEEKLEVDARQRGILAVRGNRLVVAWTLAAETDRVTWDLEKFLESFEIPPPEARARTVLAERYEPPPALQTTAPAQVAPARSLPIDGIKMAAPVARVYAHNKSKKYWTEECAGRPENAYPVAKSLAISQGFTLAENCTK